MTSDNDNERLVVCYSREIMDINLLIIVGHMYITAFEGDGLNVIEALSVNEVKNAVDRLEKLFQ